MSDTKNSMTQILEAYQAAVFDKDVDAFLRLYEEEVRVFDTWGVWSYEGIAAWRKMIEGWFASLGGERVRVKFEDVRITGGQELGVVSAIVTYAGISAEGEELRAMQNRLTWALKPSGSAWKIVHEHTSAPVGFKDSRAILQREKAS